ncbi:hypothetical protein ACH4OW_14695 [Streptomyces sp. NPDC017056]
MITVITVITAVFMAVFTAVITARDLGIPNIRRAAVRVKPGLFPRR